MRGLLKMSALSAVLSFTVVTAYNHAWSSQVEPGQRKIYQERLSTDAAWAQDARPAAPVALPSIATALKGDRLAAHPNCVDQTWPHIAPACLAASAGSQEKRVRMITIETREGENTSVLVRVPQAEIASR